MKNAARFATPYGLSLPASILLGMAAAASTGTAWAASADYLLKLDGVPG